MKTNSNINLLLMGLILFNFITINSSAQLNWNKYEDNPVMEGIPGAWNQAVWFPLVIFEDNLFKMWYVGRYWQTETRQIGYAESLDGINWNMEDYPVPVIPGGANGAWEHHKYPGTVLRINDTIKMWWTGSSNSGDDGSIGYAWAVEENEWNVFPDPILEVGEYGEWDDLMVAFPSVYYDDTTYHMYYSGVSIANGYYQIGYATSNNGINWQKNIYNPVITVGEPGNWDDTWRCSSGLVVYNDTLHMFYYGWDGTGGDPWNGIFSVGHAWSTNYKTWNIETLEEPALGVGEPGEWDDIWVHSPSVLIHEGQLKMWYTGKGVGTPLKIGYALGDMVYTCLSGGITFSTQDEIDNFPDNYPNCEIIDGNVEVNGADITNLDSLSVITAINGNLSILNCDLLSSIQGLNNLTSIDGYIKIAGNQILTSLSGLDNIEPGTISHLSIYDNSSLYICDAVSICNYLEDPSGNDTIQNNATGCNNQDQVEAACAVTTIEELNTQDKFIISPNPLGSTALLVYNLDQFFSVSIKIFDLSGREMATLVNEVQQQGEQRVVFNTAGLKPGIYFCILKTNEGVLTKKIIKL